MGLLDGAVVGVAEHALTAVAPPAGALVHIALWLRKHWQTIVVVLAIGAVVYFVDRAPWAESRGFHSRDAEVGDLKKQYADLQAADAKATAAAVQHALDVEHAQDQAKEDQHAQDQILRASANADLARHIAQLRAQIAAAGWNGRQPASGEDGGAAGGIVGTGPVSLLDAGDLQICTDNTVKALGWQGLFARLKAIPR